MATRQLSSTVGALLNPPTAVYTRDHIGENRRARKALEAEAVSRRLEAEAAAAIVPPAPTAGKFKHVPSRLAEAGLGRRMQASPVKSSCAGSPADSPASASSGGGASIKENGGSASPPKAFLKARTGAGGAATAAAAAFGATFGAATIGGGGLGDAKPFARPVIGERKPAIPTRADVLASTTSRPTSPTSASARNFVEANALSTTLAAAAPRPVPRVDPAAPLPRRTGYGAVPEYLCERKAAWAAEAARASAAAAEAAACPRGHRLLPEEERVETLRLVEASIIDTKAALNAMPLRVEIPSAVRRKGELEGKLAKLEDAAKLFARAKVFVKLDA